MKIKFVNAKSNYVNQFNPTTESLTIIAGKNQLIAFLQSFSRNAGVIVSLIGCAVFLGWILNIDILKSILPGLVTMKTNTAIGFILCGLCLLFCHKPRPNLFSVITTKKSKKLLFGSFKLSLLSRIHFSFAQVLAIIVLLIGLLTLFEYISSWNIGIDQLLFKESTNAVGTFAPNRMAPNTALNFFLLGSAGILLKAGGRKNYNLAQIFVGTALLIAILGLLGYIYNITSFYGFGSYTRMALHTAIAFVLLCLGMLCVRPNQGLIAVAVNDDAGGLLARRLFPAAIALPLILGWLILAGYRHQAYDTEVGISLFGVFNVVVFAILTWWNATVLSVLDIRRQHVENALKQANQELENRVDERTIQLNQINQQLHQRIAERFQAEEALQKSYSLIQAVMESTPEPIFAKNSEGYLLMVNSSCARILGKTAEEAIGKHNADLFPPEMAHPLTETDNRIMMTGKAETVEEVIPTDGTVKTYLVTKSPWYDCQGNIIGLIGIGRNITERKQAENEMQQALEALHVTSLQLREKNQQLEHTLHELQHTQSQLIQSEKMSSLGQLVAGIAHEINNPVNFIFGNLSHVREYSQGLLNLLHLYQKEYPNAGSEIQDEIEEIDLEFITEDLPNLLSSMKVGADRIREIVLSLRNFSRIDEADMKDVDIHEGIDSTLMILHNRLKAKPDHPNIQVIKEYGKLPRIECYAGQMNQVFMNVLTNAIDALDEYNKKRTLEDIKANPSWIKIRTEVLDGRVLIRIADNGLGMTEEVRQKLFNPFFTTKPIGKGTGLGLAISYQIVVEKHRGQVECISAPGEGAEFIIEIPTAPI